MTIKKMPVITFIFFFFLYSNTAKATDPKVALLGTWITEYHTELDINVFMRVSYESNGECSTFIEYTMPDDRKIVGIIHESWEIDDDKIRYEVLFSSNTNIVEVGIKTNVKIISFTDNFFSLKSPTTGRIFQMRRIQ